MSKIEVNTVDVKCGSTLTLGSSGKTVTIASGASTSGMGRSGTVDWQTGSIKTETFTAVNGEGYFIDTSDGTPFKNYATTVATGTQYIVGGSGNVFNLDASHQTAITMLANKTYRFTQSDSTNDGHQLIISTSNSTTLGTFQAGIVSSGITYYIDGSATQSNWLNSTTFNAGTTRYIEYKPSTTGTYYFGCYNHGIGMGGAITVAQQSVNLPAGSAGAIVSFADYTRTFSTNNIFIKPNGSEKIGGLAQDLILQVDGQSLTLVYVDSTEGWINVQNAEDTETGTPPYIVATGGTESTCGDYKIHTFTAPGDFVVTNSGSPSGTTTLEYIVAAGGGGGGSSYGGGGGAGGFRFASPSLAPLTYPGKPSAAPVGITASVTTYPVTVGAGGAGATSNAGADSKKGSNSIFSTITSAGGGAGAFTIASSGGGSPGGSGGGGSVSGSPASCSSGTQGTGNTPPVSPAQGTNGGTAYCGGGYRSGGGGGAIVAGVPSPNGNCGGQGGCGAGIPTAFGSNGVPCGSYRYYSGGGGGGGHSGSGLPGAVGGKGGGGESGRPPSSGQGSDGTTNSGGGGGGAGLPQPNNADGGAGGSGIVIIRYKFQ